MKDYFAPKAKDYDKEKRRVDNVANIANAILNKFNLSCDMTLLDFGSGTGLLLERIAPYVGKIIAIDRSSSMNSMLKQKELPCEVEIIEKDLAKEQVDILVDGIISSMTLHHIRDIDDIFKKFYNLLKPGGFIALADLDKEDGSFHTIDTGVEHFGFDRDFIVAKAKKAGFVDINIEDASIVKKLYGKYLVFLLSAKRA